MNRRQATARYRKRLLLAVAATIAFLACTAQQPRETLSVTLRKSTLLRFNRPVADVIVGSPIVAEVAVVSDNALLVSGTTVGETNLIVLDPGGREVLNVDVVVAPEPERHVTVHRGAAATQTYSCDPRCTPVTAPEDVKPPPRRTGAGAQPQPRQPVAQQAPAAPEQPDETVPEQPEASPAPPQGNQTQPEAGEAEPAQR